MVLPADKEVGNVKLLQEKVKERFITERSVITRGTQITMYVFQLDY